jgi:AraC-like DNA-binding protein
MRFRCGVRESISFLSFPLHGVDAMTAVSARSFPRHTHDQYGIGVVDAGGHASASDRKQVEAGPGSLIFVNPGEVHDGHAIHGEPRAWRILYLDPALLEEVRADISEGVDQGFMFASAVFDDAPLRQLFNAAFAHTHANVADTCEAMACETAMLRLAARMAVNATVRLQRSSAVATIRQARKRIDDDPSAALTLTGLADEAGLSRYQLLRGFARELGLTPHAYLMQQRIALARRLIRAGAPLADAAFSAGFYDQSHLTRCFQRQFGVSPGRYLASRTFIQDPH